MDETLNFINMLHDYAVMQIHRFLTPFGMTVSFGKERGGMAGAKPPPSLLKKPHLGCHFERSEESE